MTRRTKRTAAMAILAAFLLSLGNAHADAPLNPVQTVSTIYPYYGFPSTLSFDVKQNDKEMTIKSYSVKIPSGWHVASASPDPSTSANCDALVPSTPLDAGDNAEIVGYTTLTLTNDDIRSRSGPITYRGFLYHHSYAPATETATLCGYVETKSSLIPAANRLIVFDAFLQRNADGSGTLSWDYSAVTGAAPGTRSIFDNTYYQTEKTSITWSGLGLYANTDGNFNRDAGGAFAKIQYAWNPDATGTYPFIGTYTPCGLGEAGFCSSSVTPSPATKTTTLNITNYPVGHHPGPALTAPSLWALDTSTGPTTFRWNRPAPKGGDAIKGYVLTLSADYVASSKKTFYLITDKDNPGVADPNPCGVDGTASSCAFDLNWAGLLSDTGTPIPANATFSANLVAIYKDLHRSDGRCDDGTAAGAAAPCADSSVPAYDIYRGTGIARTQFLHRNTAWPLKYRKIISTTQSAYGSVWQVYVLLADLDAKKFEYVVWKPTGTTFAGGGATVIGSNAGGGVIEFLSNAGGHWNLSAVLEPTAARGLFVAITTNNQVKYIDRFDGCPAGGSVSTAVGRYPCYQSGAMTKV